MATIYKLKKNQASKKSKKPASWIWKRIFILSVVLNVLQLIAIHLKH